MFFRNKIPGSRDVFLGEIFKYRVAVYELMGKIWHQLRLVVNVVIQLSFFLGGET